MRIKHYIPIIIAGIAIPAVIYAANVTGDNLDIGLVGNSQVAAGATIGTNNQSHFRSLTVGGGNKAFEYSLSVGSANDARDLSFAVGQSNTVNVGAGQYPRRAMAVGYGNVVEAEDAACIGRSNAQNGYQGALIGMGLSNSADMATVVGSYNIDRAGVRFVVGDGEDADNPSNAFEVHDNGDVVIPKRQGDVLMGPFGNGN